jgi:hypothetical protein
MSCLLTANDSVRCHVKSYTLVPRLSALVRLLVNSVNAAVRSRSSLSFLIRSSDIEAATLCTHIHSALK